jgi:hypothetical protein
MHFHQETPHAQAVNQRLRGTPCFCGCAAWRSLAEVSGFRYGLERVQLTPVCSACARRAVPETLVQCANRDLLRPPQDCAEG